MGKIVSYFIIGLGLFSASIFLLYQVDWGSLEESMESNQQPNPYDISILGGQSVSDGDGDTLTEITHWHFEGIPWDQFVLQIDIDGGPILTCANPYYETNSTIDTQCVLVEFNGEYRDNGYFDKAERVYIKENGVNLCSTPCNIRFLFILDDVVVEMSHLTVG